MQIELIQNNSFDIFKPYIKTSEINPEHPHVIYCDGSYYVNLTLSFSCLGGLVIDTVTDSIVAEFYAPLKTKDALDQPLMPYYESSAIQSSIDVANMLKLKDVKIFNDSEVAVNIHRRKVKQKSVQIKWIPRVKNLADPICTFAKDKYKELFISNINRNKRCKEVFDQKHTGKIIFASGKTSVNGRPTYHFLALDEELRLIAADKKHIFEDNALIKFAANLLANQKLTNVNLVFSNNTYEFIRKNLFRSGTGNNKAIEHLYSAISECENVGIELNGEIFNQANLIAQKIKYKKNKIVAQAEPPLCLNDFDAVGLNQ